MLGQALREKPALRFSECSGQDSAELLIFPKCWRRARVDFSPSPDAYPDIFHPRLELLTFSEGWRPARAKFSPSRGTNLDIFRPILELLEVLNTWSACPNS